MSVHRSLFTRVSHGASPSSLSQRALALAQRVANEPVSRSTRTGLIAAGAAYPLTRRQGVLPRNLIDQSVISGIACAVAYLAAADTSVVVETVARARTDRPPRLVVAALGTLAIGAAGSYAVRRRAATAAEHGERVTIPEGMVGSAAEILAFSATATAVVGLFDVLRPPGVSATTRLPVVLAGAVATGMGIGQLMRSSPLAGYIKLPLPEGDEPLEVQVPGSLAGFAKAAAPAAAIAGVAVLAVSGELFMVDLLGRRLLRSDEIGPVARLVSHGLVAGVAIAIGAVALSGFNSRTAFEERLLEGAYANVPIRHGVSGGPDSAFDFADLGREGRRFVSMAYTAVGLSAALGRPAASPVRAFMPLSALDNGGENAEYDAADQFVAEIERLGGFDKSVLVLAAPVGVGYVSYVFAESVELMTAGDCAIAATAYSNLPSAIAMLQRQRAQAHFAHYARAIAKRCHEGEGKTRLFIFGESLGSWVSLDAFAPDPVSELAALGFEGGLFVGVPRYSEADRGLRPRDPSTHRVGSLQFAHHRDDAERIEPGFVNLSHSTDPVAIVDISVLVRHPIDYWRRPGGRFIPLITFLSFLSDVKNAMIFKPGNFDPSPGHDYRYETAAITAKAFALPIEDSERIELVLRERELEWSVRRLLSRQGEIARDTIVAKLSSWGVDVNTLPTRFTGIEKDISLPTA